MSNRRYARATVLGSCIVAILASAAAAAQEQTGSQPAASETPTELTEVVVTGSRLRRTEFTAASPVTIITTEQTTLEGLMSTSEILQTSTLAAGSQQINDQLTGFVAAGGPGANTLSLRGLGASRTLVLLNGRRLSPAGSRGQVGAADLNTIPESIVQRIEILKDGASSIYGSDAIAGVVNIITNKSLDGAQLSLEGNVTEAGGGQTSQATAAWGGNWDKGHLSASVEWYKREPLRLRDRDFLTCSQDLVKNVTDGTADPQSVFAQSTGNMLDIIDPATGASKCYNLLNNVVDRLGASSLTRANDRSGRFIPDPTAVAGGGVFGMDLAGWRRVGLSYSQTAAWAPTGATTPQLVNYWRDSQAIVPNDPERYLSRTFNSPVERSSAYVEGSFEFNPAFEVYGEFLYNKRESEQESFRQLFPNVAATNPSNPFGVTARAIPMVPSDSSQEVTFKRAVLGATGDFSLFGRDDWSYDVYAQMTQSDADYTNDIIYNDRVLATTGASACNSALITISGPVTCQPINWFNPTTVTTGVFSPAEAAFLFTKETGTTSYDQKLYGGSVSGTLFDLPAGGVSGAFGVEYRTDEIDDIPGFNARNSNLWGQTAAGRTKGSDTVKEVFGEFEVPLLKDLPMVEKLTLNLSGRWTDYESYGSDTTYKVGLNWQIEEQLRFRGSVGTSFRAPALYELFLANQTAFSAQTSVDPCIRWDTSSNPQIVENCGPNGIGLPVGWTNPNSSALIITGGGAGVLDAETSDAYTAGFVWTPDYLPFRAAIDWWRIEVDNQVAQFGSANITNQCYGDPDFPNSPFCDLFTRELNVNAPNYGQITEVRNSYVNIANQVAEGVDVNFRLQKDFGEYRFTTNAELTYNFVDTTQTFETFPEEQNRGLLYNNKWVAQIDFRLDNGPWSYNWSMDIYSAASNDAYYGGDTFGWRGFADCAFSTSTTCVSGKYDQSVGMHITNDVSVRYRAENWEVVAGVDNLFDKDPPLLSTGSGANRIGNAIAISNYDVLGRRYFLSAGYKF